MKRIVLPILISLTFNSESSFAQNWLRVGNGLPFHFGHEYNEITSFNNQLYTVGYFYNGISGSDDAYTPIVHRQSGNTWEAVNSGFSSFQIAAYTKDPIAIQEGNIGVKELTVFNRKLNARERLDALGAGEVNSIAAWNGTSWDAMGTGISKDFSSLLQL